MGGVGAWREREKEQREWRTKWEKEEMEAERGGRGEVEGEEEEERRERDRDEEEKVEEGNDDDVSGQDFGDWEGREGGWVLCLEVANVLQSFTIDMMLRTLNIDLDVIGYDRQGQRWIG